MNIMSFASKLLFTHVVSLKLAITHSFHSWNTKMVMGEVAECKRVAEFGTLMADFEAVVVTQGSMEALQNIFLSPNAPKMKLC